MNSKVTISIKKSHIAIMLGLYIATALYLLYFSPFCGRSYTHRALQLIPFRTVISQLTMPHGFDLFVGNMAGNVIVLLPVGFFLSLLGVNIPRGRAIALFLITATLVETLQYIFWVGCMDIDDIWMNAAGGLLGLYLGRRILVGKEEEKTPHAHHTILPANS
ncbi:MAG: VanZ family protein [Spirochaetales bacterium]|nr:VanZ family protein [Spirochaetales bacterium]